ncbi:acyltransferase family protein [Alloyangia pacifica]|uniref:acyltransferase family protein n=1 Tax=Alloyangia pacifica TaxID=311180 RepID=UPI001CFE9013|nr:acyltransferase family protein [Alloyangia pacifica]
MKYRAHIDGLRAFAVIPVVAFHASHSSVPGGFLGVDVFFVISGFLITSLLISDLEAKTYSIADFYERRARRILPALFFVVACTIPAALIFLPPSDLKTFGMSVAATMTFLSNIFFLKEVNYFETHAELNPLLHTWSLAVEEQFYIVYPLILALVIRKAPRFLWHALLAAGLASAVLALWASDTNPKYAFYLFPMRAWELLIGALAALGFKHAEGLTGTRLLNLLSATGLAAILLSYFFVGEALLSAGLVALPACVGAALVILFTRPGTAVHWLLTRRWIVLIGLISYSAYLWHQPIITFYKHAFPDDAIGVVVSAIVTFPIAWLTWRFVEQPFRRRKTATTPPRPVLLSSAVALTAFFCAGLALTAGNGWDRRYSAEERRVLSSFVDAHDYVPGRFDSLKGRDFSGDAGIPKVLIVGDSYGQDLVNALYETGMQEKFDLSTYHIPGHCGNLMLEDLGRYQPPESREGCAGLPGYKDPTLLDHLRHADQVWLVSSWNAWTAPLLPQSLDAMSSVTDAEIIVFGRKHFGDRLTHRFFAEGLDALVGPRELPETLAAVSLEMSKTIPAVAPYIDLQWLLCGNYSSCTNADSQGSPLTFDGTHLTPEGARYLGTLLRPYLMDQLQAGLHTGTLPSYP